MELEKIVAEILPLHGNFLSPIYKRTTIPIQASLDGFYPSETNKAVTMGTFYEVVNHAFYGGKLNDVKFDADFFKGDLGENGVKPDVIDEEGGIIWESKACCTGHSCNITDRQLDGYKSFQYDSPEKSVFFSIYRHFLRGIRKEKRTKEEIIGELLQKTSFSVVLPFSVILKLKEVTHSQGTTLSRNYKPKAETVWPDCLCINSPTINRFLYEPEKNLEMLGFAPGRFQIERYMSPLNFRVNRKKLNQFPIVKITDLKYKEWVDALVRGYDLEDEETLSMSEGISEEDIPF